MPTEIESLIRAAATVCVALVTALGIPAAHAQCGPSQTPRPIAAGTSLPAWPLPKRPRPIDWRPEASRSQGGQASIVGLWNISFLIGGQIVDQGFDVWHADGTELLNDNPPPASGNVLRRRLGADRPQQLSPLPSLVDLRRQRQRHRHRHHHAKPL